MLKLRNDDIQDWAYKKIETATVMAARSALTAVLLGVEDKVLRDEIADAANAWAYEQADAALAVGYEMALHPHEWLWEEVTEEQSQAETTEAE